MTASFLLDEDGRPLGILGVTRDITERNKAQREKEKLLESLSQSKKMEAIGRLAGGVAHDLNNVLSGIVSYPDLLLWDLPADSPLRRPIETIQESGKKAAAIVQDLLTLARRGVSVSEVVNLNEVIQEYLTSPEFQRMKSFHPLVTITTRLDPELLHILGSPVHLSKTIMNLVSNAAEAMPEGGEIMVTSHNTYLDRPVSGYTEVREGEYTVIKVADTGIGISAEDIQRIFEPFYTKKKMGRSGTGLGMAVVWGTVEDHQGYIEIQSASGKGTTVTLYLPGTRREKASKAAPNPMDRYRGQGETVLVVDDLEEQREIATRILNQLGYGAKSVASGEEAVDFIRREKADLIVLDMIMDPGMDGLDTYEEILRLNPRQRAIIVSGFSESDRVKETQKLGAGFYLRKPYTVEALAMAVQWNWLHGGIWPSDGPLRYSACRGTGAFQSSEKMPKGGLPPSRETGPPCSPGFTRKPNRHPFPEGVFYPVELGLQGFRYRLNELNQRLRFPRPEKPPRPPPKPRPNRPRKPDGPAAPVKFWPRTPFAEPLAQGPAPRPVMGPWPSGPVLSPRGINITPFPLFPIFAFPGYGAAAGTRRTSSASSRAFENRVGSTIRLKRRR